MSDFLIRPASPDDAPEVVALRATVHPYLVRGEHSTRTMISSPLPGDDWAGFVAVGAGRVVGWVAAHRELWSAEPDFGRISLLHVAPAYRRRGIGAALYAAAAAHLRSVGMRRAAATCTPEALRFAHRHGFTPSRELRYSALTLTSSDFPTPPPGIRLAPLRDIDARSLYEADIAAAADEPGDTPAAPAAYSTWRHGVWDNPDLDFDASAVALAGAKIVSFSLVLRDGDRIWSDLTATVPAYRGRGLALLAKRAALRWAVDGGARVAYTCNDETNAPMLAVNSRLGYRPVATQHSCVGAL